MTIGMSKCTIICMCICSTDGRGFKAEVGGANLKLLITYLKELISNPGLGVGWLVGWLVGLSAG